MNNVANFLNGPAGVAVAVVLLAMLAIRELARVSARPRGRALARALTVAATPMLVIFLASVALLLAQSFR